MIDLEAHRAVFTWVLQCLSTAGLVKGKTIGIDATTLGTVWSLTYAAITLVWRQSVHPAPSVRSADESIACV